MSDTVSRETFRRKLPSDATLAALIRFGFRTSDIADRFETSPEWISRIKRQLGFAPDPNDGTRHRRNGARPASRYFG